MRRWLGLTAIVLIGWLAAPARPALAAENTWAGTWQTSWTGGTNGSAEMTLTQTGSAVTGTYNHLLGTIQGSVTGDRLEGTWTQSNDGGGLSFRLSADGRSWSGTWTGGAGGTWQGSCTGGACLANAMPVTPASTTAKRSTATVVRCNRDASDIPTATFRCTAVVADAGGSSSGQLPTGTVTWTSTVGSFTSGASCALRLPDVGLPQCAVDYAAPKERVPIGSAVPVAAHYGGDAGYTGSDGSPKLGPGLAAPDNGGVPGWAIAGGGVAAVGILALAGVWFLHAHSAGGALALAGSTSASGAGAGSAGGEGADGAASAPAGTPDPEIDPATWQVLLESLDSLGKGASTGKSGANGKGGTGKQPGTSQQDLDALRRMLERLGDHSAAP